MFPNQKTSRALDKNKEAETLVIKKDPIDDQNWDTYSLNIS
jgi:hypothetical protein